ncbi:hypothetical protein [Escherichia coli]|uniref:hypothetical protein n=1 Tax=Escherichia coli TaxID=562 RepID=UPI001CDB7BC2|nr:hypothetical protein [Escherichia coli]
MNIPGETRTITLYTCVTLGGGAVERITCANRWCAIALPSPRPGTEEEKEARMIAQLCNLSEQDIGC